MPLSRYWILLLVVFVLAAACAHFPVAEGMCPYVSGYEHVLSADDPACKLRCLQELAYDCYRFGPR